MTDVGLSEQLRLVELVATETATVLANPLTGETVTVEVPRTPAFMNTGVGLDVIVKSWIVNVTVAEREMLALVPVIVTWVVEVDENVHDSVALPEPVRLEGAIVHDVLLVDRATGAEKPFEEVTLIVDVPVEPTSSVTLVGFTDTV